MNRHTLLLPLLALASHSANAGEMSAQAAAVWHEYKVEWCEAAKEVAGYTVPNGATPLFETGAKAFRQIELTHSGVVGELIFTGDMRCNGYPIYQSVGGNSTSFVIVDDQVMEFFGGEPFIIDVDASRTPAPEFFSVKALIAWWGYGKNCGYFGENGFSVGIQDCLRFVYYSDTLGSLIVQSPDDLVLPEAEILR